MPIRHREPALEQRTHLHLSVLYEVSKAVSAFETVEQSFPSIMRLAAGALPLLAAVLVEQRGGTITSTVWHEGTISQKLLDDRIVLAKLIFGQLVGSLAPKAIPRLEGIEYVALPLAVYRHPTFGVLLLRCETRVSEMDLTFIDALTNLIAVAVDRYYTSLEVTQLQESHISDLEAERELRETFVSILAHDLRNPLSAAKMSAGMLVGKSKDSTLCDKMGKRIIASIDRVDHMVENLLDANRIRAGEKLPLTIEKIDLKTMLKSTLGELSDVYGDRFVVLADEDVKGYWSRDGVRRVVENLISNAVKYGAPDRPITVSLKQTSARVQIAVHNEGNQIPSADLPHLFEQFRRTKTAQASGQRGWGLGLTLVRGVVEALGGTVKVESKRGTTFTLELPIDSRPFLCN